MHRKGALIYSNNNIETSLCDGELAPANYGNDIYQLELTSMHRIGALIYSNNNRGTFFCDGGLALENDEDNVKSVKSINLCKKKKQDCQLWQVSGTCLFH